MLELPPTSEPPATLQWLPRARTAEEVSRELRQAFAKASGPTQDLAEALGDLPLAIPPQAMDWHWWLHQIGQDRGAEELNLTQPLVSLTAAGGDDADFVLSLEHEGRPLELAQTGDADLIEHFSSGERRWVDEALATVARELTRFGHRAALHAQQFTLLNEDAVMDAVMSVASRAEQTALEYEFWTGETFDLLLQALEPQLIAAERAFAEENENPMIRAIHFDQYPGLALLQPQLVIRVFDEPEAHLHPSAQRRIAKAIDSLRLRGENVVIASHSPQFLDLPTWSLVHVRPDERGAAQVEILPEEANSARSELAAQLGVGRGELLTNINTVLVVEGKHDQVVLQRLFGTELQSAGIAVVRMHGTSNLLATAELDFLDRYLDIPIVVLLDYTRVERVLSGRPTTNEEKALQQLSRSLGQRKRQYRFVGLHRPDIVCYMSEAAVRDVYPDFPGWPAVLSSFESRTSRPTFKPWLQEQFGVDLIDTYRIESVLDCMVVNNHHPVGELTRRVKEIVSHVPGAIDGDLKRAPDGDPG
ncbi:MAG TPA: AAA family ATPase [Propionibacteriaceae bacterium]|nr:AAA family ATPase [Propionibacteriaceae bacterium]